MDLLFVPGSELCNGKRSGNTTTRTLGRIWSNNQLTGFVVRSHGCRPGQWRSRYHKRTEARSLLKRLSFNLSVFITMVHPDAIASLTKPSSKRTSWPNRFKETKKLWCYSYKRKQKHGLWKFLGSPQRSQDCAMVISTYKIGDNKIKAHFQTNFANSF